MRKTFVFPFRFLVQILSKKLVFDFDDAIFVKSSGKKSELRMRRFKALTSKAHQVWAGNRYLAQNAQKYCPSVKILPTAINTDKYDKDSIKTDEYIDIVWIGSSSTRKYLEQLVPTLDELAHKTPGIRLKIIADFDLETKYIKTSAIAWTDASEAKELASSHIGIAMIPDDPWSRGKCGLKLIQYMAASLPVVASNTGVHPDIVEHSVSGFLVNNKKEWIKALSSLIKNRKQRDSFGARGYDIVKKKYSYNTTTKQMIDHLNKLI
ncbi:MAG: glycosyltransferase family 4 protein [Desulfobacula sp.]|nr:glycosyltransferase family 4 protein [Desulfobacula sp.]